MLIRYIKHIISKKSPLGGFRGPLLLLIGVLFFSCSEENNGGIEQPDATDSFLRVNIRKDATATYAVGDEPAYTSEKEMKSIAFFVKCGDKGTPGSVGFRNGAFNKFFSTEELRSAHGLYEPFEETTGGYNTTIRVKGDAIENPTKVMVIANYAENGLRDALMAVTRWEDLENIKTPVLTNANLETPLLMYALDESLSLTQGNTLPVNFNLKRVVSRIDVINRAFDPDDATKGFVLEKAQIISPRERSYLVPGNAKRHNIATLESLPSIAVGNAPAYDDNQVVGLYLYETDNADAGMEKTKIRIEGKFFNIPYSKTIEMKLPDVSHSQPGDPIAMQRNHLYRVIINAFTTDEVEADIEVVDWADGTELNLKPTQKAPVLSDFVVSKNDVLTRWDETKKSFTYEGKEKETIKFKATGNQAMLSDFTCSYITPNVSVGLEDPNNEAYKELIMQGKPVITYASISQEYTLTLPKFKDPYPVYGDVYITIYIRNATSPQYADSIKVNCFTGYPGVNIAPVKIGNLYWAPVNVGATTIENSPQSFAGTGYMFQWGRNVPFNPFGSVPTTSGPLTYAQTLATNKYIVYGPTGDWLEDNTADRNKRDNLWSKAVNDSPCPKGWRVPTRAELSTLNGRYITQSNYRFSYRGDNGDTLYISYYGFIDWNGTNSSTSTFYLWSADFHDKNNASYFGGTSTSNRYKFYAHPIRCVRDIQ